MTIRLDDLTTDQVRFLERLDDGPEEDSVGLEVADMQIGDFRALQMLIMRGLVELSKGWGGTFWFRLTRAGRQVRENGAA